MKINIFAKNIFLTIVVISLFFAVFAVSASAEEIIARSEGTLSPGATGSFKFYVDRAKIVHVRGSGVDLSEGSTQFALILINPQGTRIDLFAQPAHPSIKVEVKQGFTKGKGIRDYRTLDILNPPVGYWTAEIILSQKSTSTQRYHIEISCDGSDITLQQESKDLSDIVSPGKPTLIEVQLLKNGKPYSDSRAFFVLRLETIPIMAKQDPGDFNLRLYDDGSHGDKMAGDGIYTTTFTPDKAGEYFFRIDAASPGKFERLAWTSVQVSAQGAHLTGNIKEEPIDNDHNGKYEALKLIVEVDISVEEMGIVEARLRDKAGTVIGDKKRGFFWNPSVQRGMPPSAYEQLPTAIGVHEILLIFPGGWFLRTKSDGPYFAEVEITNPELVSPWPLAELKTPYQTKAYRWQDFEKEER